MKYRSSTSARLSAKQHAALVRLGARRTTMAVGGTVAKAADVVTAGLFATAHHAAQTSRVAHAYVSSFLRTLVAR